MIDKDIRTSLADGRYLSHGIVNEQFKIMAEMIL